MLYYENITNYSLARDDTKQYIIRLIPYILIKQYALLHNKTTRDIYSYLVSSETTSVNFCTLVNKHAKHKVFRENSQKYNNISFTLCMLFKNIKRSIGILYYISQQNSFLTLNLIFFVKEIKKTDICGMNTNMFEKLS